MVDFHTHLLAHMDDGARDGAASHRMAESLATQGVTLAVCTPHFYPYAESAGDFTARRDRSFRRLCEVCGDIGGIRFLKGAEVYCDDALGYRKDLTDLRIEGTPYILVELPFRGTLSRPVRKILRLLRDRHSLVPVIAHAERYPAIRRMPLHGIRMLRSLGCGIQINCDSLADRHTRRIALKIIAHGLADVLGTDCHDPDRRPPRMREALEVVAESLGPQAADRLVRSAEAMTTRTASGSAAFGAERTAVVFGTEEAAENGPDRPAGSR